jgi:hypothetical protein
MTESRFKSSRRSLPIDIALYLVVPSYNRKAYVLPSLLKLEIYLCFERTLAKLTRQPRQVCSTKDLDRRSISIIDCVLCQTLMARCPIYVCKFLTSLQALPVLLLHHVVQLLPVRAYLRYSHKHRICQGNHGGVHRRWIRTIELRGARPRGRYCCADDQQS